MLKITRLCFSFFVIVVISGCAGNAVEQTTDQGCTDEWFRLVDEQIQTGDGQGHGPDLGSLEWRSTVEFKLGLRDDPVVPRMESEQWCRYINEYIRL